MNWKKLFAPSIIKIGKDLEEEGRVELYSKDTNLYTGNVTDFGGHTYTVQVIDNGNGMPPSLYCNCDDFTNGIRCSHLAAFFYYLEEHDEGQNASVMKKERKGKGNIPADEAFPMPDSDDDSAPAYQRKYHFYTVSRALKNFKIQQKAYDEALDIIHRNEIKISDIHSGFISRNWLSLADQDDDNQALFVTCDYVGGRATHFGYSPKKTVKLVMSRNDLLSYSCGVPGCDRYDPYGTAHSLSAYERRKPLCAHVIAALYLTNEYLIKNPNITDTTDLAGHRLLESFAESGFVPDDQKAEKDVVITPRLKINHKSGGYFYGSRWIYQDRTELSVDFKVGRDRPYLVKNLNELIEKYRNREVYSLGKKSDILFSKEDFTDTSKKMYDFIVSYIEEESYRQDVVEGSKTMTAKELMLYGKRLDDFFDLVKGHSLEVNAKNLDDEIRSPVKADDHDLTITLTATAHKDSDGEFDGITLNGYVPTVLEGIRGAYYFSGGIFARISRENAKAIRPFVKSADDGIIEFVIGRGNLAQFYYHILPQIEKYVHLNSEDTQMIENYLPPESTFSFFLDADNDDVFCEVKAVYGDFSYNLTDTNEIKSGENFYRDIDRENQIIDAVNSFFPDYDPKSGRFSCDKDPDTVYRIITEGVNSLMKLGDVNTSDQFNRLTVRRGWHLSVGVSVKSDLLSLNVLSSDIPMDELADVLTSYRAKRKYHRLKNGDFLSFEDNDSVAALEDMMEDLHLSVKEFTDGKMDVPAYRALYLNKMLEEHDEIATDRDKNFKSLVKSFKTLKDADYEVPLSLKNVLRNYQKEGFRWILTLAGYSFGGILADEMGLGKTLQMISALVYEKEQGTLERSLIVCPASLVYNWQSEFRRFAPELEVIPIDGPKSGRKKTIEGGKGDVLITSYDLLRRDINLYDGQHFGYMVLDEAQYIKNPKSGISKAVKTVKASHRFALTGTPIENRLSELWSIFDFLMPGFLYDYDTFRTDYESPIVNDQDEELTKRLSAMTSPFILRRKKESVLKDLPDKIEEVRYTAFESAQKKIYDSQLVRMKNLIDQTSQEDFNKNRMKILADITRLRQICCDPSLIIEDYKGESAKRQLLMELIEEAIDGGHKMLVFSQFTSMLELIQKDLEERGIPFYLITGATPKKKRLELVNDFNGNEVPVFLISLKAGGTGLNLIGADVVIHYDPWWNAAAENQATDRAHRIGQTSKVSVFKLIVKDTIEEKILKMQEEKLNLADEILNGEGTSFFNLSKEELLDLLE
ncbi:MAG: DEAD/DEAH box helicase [Lachnospiraceae bacterium]|nr:DEAD/DEAH box helicase [Lachnospiraceae bacterium]